MAAKQAKTLEGSYIYSKVGKDGQGEYFTTITALIIQRLFQLAKIIAISAVGWLAYERWSEDEKTITPVAEQKLFRQALDAKKRQAKRPFSLPQPK